MRITDWLKVFKNKSYELHEFPRITGNYSDKFVLICGRFFQKFFTAYLRQFIYFVGLLIFMGLVYTGVVEAHAGGKMQVASEDAGPFKLTVWTSPDPAVTGEIHVAAAVASAEDALPVLDAEVFVELTSVNGGEVLSEQATTDNSANQFLYEVIFEVPNEGLYEVTVTAIGGVDWGNVSFDLEVGSAPPLGLGIVALVALAIVTGGAVWFYLRSTSPQAQVEEVDEFDAVAS